MKTLLSILSITFFTLGAQAWVLKGGNLDKTDFDSEIGTKGRVSVLFYVSPSKKNLNNEASEAIKAENFDSKYYASMGVIDMKSSWIPNALISSSIKKKQKKYPRTIYLKDYDRNMHRILNFKPQGNDIFVFDANGKEIYRQLGKLNQEQIKTLVQTIKTEVNKIKN